MDQYEVKQKDYRELDIPDGSVIYCDPPYKGTAGYGCEFNYEAFYDWCEVQTCPVFISEYSMPEDRFECVWSQDVRALMSGAAGGVVTERLFIPRRK